MSCTHLECPHLPVALSRWRRRDSQKAPVGEGAEGEAPLSELDLQCFNLAARAGGDECNRSSLQVRGCLLMTSVKLTLRSSVGKQERECGGGGTETKTETDKFVLFLGCITIAIFTERKKGEDDKSR